MKLFSRFAGQGLRGILPAVAVGAAALLYAAFQAWRVSSGAWENALVMVLFAAVAGWDAVKGPATAGPSRGARLTAWGLLGAGLVLAVLPWGVSSGLPGRCALLFAVAEPESASGWPGCCSCVFWPFPIRNTGRWR